MDDKINNGGPAFPVVDLTLTHAAQACYEIADAMLRARGSK